MRPTLGVSVAIVQGQQILLVKRADFPVWCLPGGAVDAGESMAQAAVRETQEETGLVVELDRAVGIYSRPRWDLGSHTMLFTAHPVGGQLLTTTNETVNAGYFERDKLPEDLLWWFHRQIDDVFQLLPFVVRTQDAVLPYGTTTRAELYTRLRQGDLDMTQLVAELCTIPATETEIPDLP